MSNGMCPTTTAWKPLEQPLLAHRALKVICVGAGLSGMHLTALVKEFGPGIQLQIYERNPEIGGTWFNNRYPGVACDVPSHGYTLSWAPWPDWPRFQADGAATLEYCKFVADRCGVRDHTKFNVNVESATWDSQAGVWKVEYMELDTGKKQADEAQVFVNASGILSQPRLPHVKDFEKFKGEVLHSGDWDTTVNLAGKRVALVGAGSSSIQILPVIQPLAAHIDQYVRSATWILPPPAPEIRAKHWGMSLETAIYSDEPGDVNPSYSKAEMNAFRSDPATLNNHRREQLQDINQQFNHGSTIIGSPFQIQGTAFAEAFTRTKLSRKPELADLFVPDWGVGCRRGTPGPGFLRALQQDNVDVVRGAVVAVTPKGLVASDGIEREYDAVIYATGFDTSFRPPFKVVGLRGFSPNSKEYLDNPTAYMVASTPNLPNYFTVHGPLLMSFNGDFLGGQERTVNYIFKCILKLQRERYKSVVVKLAAVDGLMAYADAYLPRTVHSQNCSSWYKNGTKDGRIRAIWPGTSIHMMKTMEHPRWEEYDWEPLDEDKSCPAARFAYLGNGRTYLEGSESPSLVGYLPVVSDPYAKVPEFGSPLARKHFESWE